MKAKILKISGYVIILVAMGYLAVLRFTNPDITSVRFFMTYWWQIILAFAWMMGGTRDEAMKEGTQ